jgi:hypothetical protein
MHAMHVDFRQVSLCTVWQLENVGLKTEIVRLIAVHANKQPYNMIVDSYVWFSQLCQ